jgi:Ca2+-binding RTX toxin-like protein
MKRKKDVMRVFALATLLSALAGCTASEPPAQSNRGDLDPVEAAVAELGVEIDGCKDSAFTTQAPVLTLNVSDSALVLSTAGGKFTANGYPCYALTGKTPLTTLNVGKIVIVGDEEANKVILDFLPGSFGTKVLGATGGIDVDFATDGGEEDSLMIRGLSTGENYKIGQGDTDDFVYLEVTGDKNADVRVKPHADGLKLTVSLGGGADTLTASPIADSVLNFNNMLIAGGVVKLSEDYGVIAYGGALIDTFTGGDGDDEFYGGAGADIFKMGDEDDGADVYQGDADLDTVDYSNRTEDLFIDVGPQFPGVKGTADLAKIADWDELDAATITIAVDGGDPIEVEFTTPAKPSDLLDAINAALVSDPDEDPLALATLTGQNQIEIVSLNFDPDEPASIEITAMSAGLDAILGLAVVEVTDNADADDGLDEEGDDVRWSTENITGGEGDDLIVGSSLKNLIKGGLGNDTLSGGYNTTNTMAAEGDTLQGEAGDDTFLMPSLNNNAALTGGAGTNVADFSGRSGNLALTNNGLAFDGEGVSGAEKVNIAIDILKMIGGFGADTITGGTGADTIVGGPGADVMSGGAGIDTVDYSDRTEDTQGVEVTLCFDAAAADCDAINGETGEMDKVHLFEHVIGGAGEDMLSAEGATVSVTLEGRDDDDEIIGGNGADELWGDDGDDSVSGGAGNDNVSGGVGEDVLDGGDDDGGDICLDDGEDTVDPVNCEL